MWKDIKGYEGLYQVSDEGEVRSVERKVKTGRGERTVKSKVLKQTTSKATGHKIVNLIKNGNKTSKLVSFLVSEAFETDIKKEPKAPSWSHKLSSIDVDVIRSMCKFMKRSDIAKYFDISEAQISKIINNKSRIGGE